MPLICCVKNEIQFTCIHFNKQLDIILDNRSVMADCINFSYQINFHNLAIENEIVGFITHPDAN